jgi:hypothetical protein
MSENRTRKLFKPWTPAQIATALWIDGSNTGSISLNGSNVSQWNDLSGNNKHVTQGTSASQPVYDPTDKTVNFIADHMLIPNVVSKAGICIGKNYYGTHLTPSLNYYTPLGGASASQFIGLAAEAAPTYTITVDGATANTGDASVNGYALTPGNGTGTNINITNAGEDLSPFPYRDSFDLVYFQVNISITWAYLGRDNTNNRNAYGDIGELVLLTNAPTLSIIQNIEGYLAHKWGIASKLPSNHPYKSIPPKL